MSRIRSVLLTSDLPPRPGGISNYLGQLYLHMRLPEHLIVGPTYAGDIEWDRAYALPVVRAHLNLSERWANDALYHRPFDRLWRPFAMLRALRRCGGSMAGTMLHCGQVMSAGLVGRLLKHKQGCPYLLFLFGGEVRKYEAIPSMRRLFRSIVSGAAGAIAVSRFALQAAEPFLDAHVPKSIVSPGVDHAFFRPHCGGSALRTRLGLDGHMVILTVARLVATKGHARVIAALPDLLRLHPCITYLVVGRGPEEVKLRQQVASLGLDAHVRFMGGVPDAELPAYYDAADVFALASRDCPNGQVEGFGMVLLEASACGTPVVATRSGGTVEAVLHGQTGLLVDQDPPSQFTEAVASLLSDAALRDRLGQAGRQWVLDEMGWNSKASALATFLRGPFGE